MQIALNVEGELALRERASQLKLPPEPLLLNLLRAALGLPEAKLENGHWEGTATAEPLPGKRILELPKDVEEALKTRAAELNTRPQYLAYNLVRRQLGLPEFDFTPKNEWEARLINGAKDYDVSIPDEALSSEGLYD